MIFRREVIGQFHCKLLLSPESAKTEALEMNISYASTFTHHLDSLPSNSIKLVFLWSKISSMTTIETLCNMIVLAVRLKGTLFGRQIVLSMHQKMDKENSPGQNFRTAPYYIKHSVLEQSKQWQIQYIAIGKTDLFNNWVWGYAEILSSLISQANILIFSWKNRTFFSRLSYDL